MCDLNQEKGELEEKFWRSNIALSILPEEDGLQYDKELKTTFLKLFAVCIKYILYLLINESFILTKFIYSTLINYFRWHVRVVMI